MYMATAIVECTETLTTYMISVTIFEKKIMKYVEFVTLTKYIIHGMDLLQNYT